MHTILKKLISYYLIMASLGTNAFSFFEYSAQIADAIYNREGRPDWCNPGKLLENGKEVDKSVDEISNLIIELQNERSPSEKVAHRQLSKNPDEGINEEHANWLMLHYLAIELINGSTKSIEDILQDAEMAVRPTMLSLPLSNIPADYDYQTATRIYAIGMRLDLLVAEALNDNEYSNPRASLRIKLDPRNEGNNVVYYLNNARYNGSVTKITDRNGNVYSGPIQNGMANGEGRAVFANGDVYKGSWRNGAKYGYGRYVSNNGCTYEGEWLGNEQHGYGVEVYKARGIYENDEKYEGNFFSGRIQGYGRYTYSDGEMYEGEWLDDEQHGFGKCSLSDGTTYIGGIDDGEPCGVGIYDEMGTGNFHAELSDGTATTEAKILWTSSALVEIAFETRGTVYGRRTLSDSSIYFGEFRDGIISGFGCTVRDGALAYVGQFENGNKHGKGAETFSNGETYLGSFVAGKKHGNGLYTNRDQTLRIGSWENDEFQGR